MIFKKKDEPLKCFFDENRSLNYLRQVDRYIRTVEIDKIKGSVGRCMDFDAQLNSKSGAGKSMRFKRIKQSMAEGSYYPVVELNKLADEYYILDGHHRLSAAKQLGWKFIDAHVVEYLPSKTKLSKERHDFEEKTALKGIILTQPEDYRKLFNLIRIYHEDFAGETDRQVTLKDAAQQWFEDGYQKIRKRIEDLKLHGQNEGETIDDAIIHLLDQMHLRLRKQNPDDASYHKAWEALCRLCMIPSLKGSKNNVLEKVKRIFLPCFLTGKCES